MNKPRSLDDGCNPEGLAQACTLTATKNPPRRVFCWGKIVDPAVCCWLQLLAFHEVVHAAFSQAEPLIGFAAVVGVICVDFFPLRIGVA